MKYLHANNIKASPWKNGDTYAWSVVLGWLVTSPLGRILSDTGYEEISRSWIDEWILNKILVGTLNNLGLDDKSTWRAVTLIKLLTSHHEWWKVLDTANEKIREKPSYQILTRLLSDTDTQTFLGVNRYQDVLWFNKEAYEDLLWWLFTIASVEIAGQSFETDKSDEVSRLVLRCYTEISSLIESAEASGYKLEKLLDLVG